MNNDHVVVKRPVAVMLDERVSFDVNELPSNAMAAYKYWHQLYKDNGCIPQKQMISPMKLGGSVLKQTVILEVKKDILPKIRLSGSVLDFIYGKNLDDIGFWSESNPQNQDNFANFFNEMLEGDAIGTVEFLTVAAKNPPMPCSAHFFPLTNKDGDVRFLFGVFDISKNLSAQLHIHNTPKEAFAASVVVKKMTMACIDSNSPRCRMAAF